MTYLLAKKTQGMSLIELMIVIIIIGILAMIVYPTFTEHIKKARRTDAKSALAELAQLQESYFSTYRSYAGTLDVLLGSADKFGFKRSGENQYLSKDGYYQLTNNTTEDKQSFFLQAFAIEKQATDEHCARFEISSTGEKAAFNKGNQSQNDCW